METHGKPMKINGHNRKIGVDIGSIMVLESSRSNQQWAYPANRDFTPSLSPTVLPRIAARTPWLAKRQDRQPGILGDIQQLGTWPAKMESMTQLCLWKMGGWAASQLEDDIPTCQDILAQLRPRESWVWAAWKGGGWKVARLSGLASAAFWFRCIPLMEIDAATKVLISNGGYPREYPMRQSLGPRKNNRAIEHTSFGWLLKVDWNIEHRVFEPPQIREDGHVFVQWLRVGWVVWSL